MIVRRDNSSSFILFLPFHDELKLVRPGLKGGDLQPTDHLFGRGVCYMEEKILLSIYIQFGCKHTMGL